MKKRKETGGRFLVGEKTSPSLGAALAYAAHLSFIEARTVYVRLVGSNDIVGRAEYDDSDRSVTIAERKGQ